MLKVQTLAFSVAISVVSAGAAPPKPTVDVLTPSDEELGERVIEFFQKDARAQAAHRFGSIQTAVKLLSASLRSPLVKGDGKSEGAQILGGLGLGDTIPLFKELAQNPADDSARDFAYGFLQASKAFPDVVPLKERFVAAMWPTFRRGFPLGDTHEIALELDEKTALEGILAPENWTIKNPVFRSMIQALAWKNVSLPVEKLMAVLPELEGAGEGSAQMRANVLYCLALVAPAQAEPLILAELGKPRGQGMFSGREELSKALCAAKGLVNPYGKILERLDKHRFKGIDVSEQKFIAVMLYYYSTNEALSAFFEYHERDKWNVLRQAFSDIGAPKSVALLDAWAKVFPKVKPGQKGFDLGTEEARFQKKTGASLYDELERVEKGIEGLENDELVPLAYLWLAENADKILTAWKPKPTPPKRKK